MENGAKTRVAQLHLNLKIKWNFYIVRDYAVRIVPDPAIQSDVTDIARLARDVGLVRERRQGAVQQRGVKHKHITSLEQHRVRSDRINVGARMNESARDGGDVC